MRVEDLPDLFESVETNERPGEPLYPGENTIVGRGNNPLRQGETVDVYVEVSGDNSARVRLEVIDDDDGDIICIPDDETPLTASSVVRISADLRTVTVGTVYGVPSYDADEGVLNVSREVKTSEASKYLTVVEARNLGGRQEWSIRGESGV